ncbi:hypothetical protein BDP81DRAFT_451429 [Colletotrichum phormii]|uniref:Uncharacterized protein n=1 Tax=Colletotrichum phormii TaxID=359342 RepID=A0AAJ0EDQ3_9PEZI|nr:uncharacterized protein BDP81DRAFT_451429 [Colletotrichum phormii]KAK1634958.1 hypothetical protein BDP81DRAFT_451429 [Colletotrichum phormii]
MSDASPNQYTLKHCPATKGAMLEARDERLRMLTREYQLQVVEAEGRLQLVNMILMSLSAQQNACVDQRVLDLSRHPPMTRTQRASSTQLTSIQARQLLSAYPNGPEEKDNERKKPANAAVIDVFVGGAFDSMVMAVTLRVTHAMQDPPPAEFGTTLPRTSTAEDAKHPQYAFRDPASTTKTDCFTA